MSLKIVIAGLGLIGGSLAKAFKKYGGCAVAGIDRDPKVIKAAMDCGAIDKAGTREDINTADIIYLCLYPQGDVDFVRENLKFIRRGCIITDTCGIKSFICPRLSQTAKENGFIFIGGHPMAGKEKSGFGASDADLFKGASYILVPCGAPRNAVDTLKTAVMNLGFSGTVETTPQEHDKMIAFTSQLPHVLACAYVMSPQCPNHRGFSAGSYRDVSRVANINENMWAELFIDNREALTEELDILIENITKIKNAVSAADAQTLRDLLREGREIKERLCE